MKNERTIILSNPMPINGRVRYTNKSNDKTYIFAIDPCNNDSKEDKPVLIAEGDRYGIRLV